MRRHTDYALARRALLRDLRRGSVARHDVCDAHPELLRAARHVGEPAAHECPVCSARHVSYVSYVYGDHLRQANGRCIVHPNELERLGAAHDEFARYVVEVCPDCGWNFLTRRELHGRRHGGAPTPAEQRPGRARSVPHGARCSGAVPGGWDGAAEFAAELVFPLPPGAV